MAKSSGMSTPYDLDLAFDAAPDERTFWRKLKRVAARLPFAADLVAAWYCAMDRDTPAHVRAVLLGAVAYFILPTDVLPDFVAGLGFTDDASVLAAALSTLGRYITPAHRKAAQSKLDELNR